MIREKPAELKRRPGSLAFSQIIGVSEYNPRHGEELDDGLESLAATLAATGQINPLFVRAEKDGFTVLDGSRRWRAMRLLVQRSVWTDETPVNVEFLTGPEAALRAFALATNLQRRALHPVEEYEAFVEMSLAGYAEDRIAKDFGLDLRRVRQRLALGRLHPKIRSAWRKGEIMADVAKAYCASDSLEAQEALFDEFAADQPHQPGRSQSEHTIRFRLLRDSLGTDSKEALYVGLEAYRAAGGRLRESLFEEEVSCLDGSLLKRLAREKLLAEAEKIAAEEGWGFVVHADDDADGDFKLEPDDFQYTPKENERLDQIDTATGWSQTQNLSAEERCALEEEGAKIEQTAALRTFAQAERASLGLYCNLLSNGKPDFSRGWEQEQPAGLDADDDPPSNALPRAVARETMRVTQVGEASKDDKPTAAVRDVLNKTIDHAVYETIRTHSDLAMVFLVARLGCEWEDMYGVVDLCGSENSRFKSRVAPLLRRLRDKSFSLALPICADAPISELTEAFAELVAGLFHADKMSLDERHPLPLAMMSRGISLRDAFVEAFEPQDYFLAATKASALACLSELQVPAVDRHAKKPVLADLAATEAAGRTWLPAPLVTWSNFKPKAAKAAKVKKEKNQKKPLAQAMAEAIEEDEEGVEA
jgi:ParB family chromosome partitioning protein